MDTRNIVYADEGDPLDLYRTILRLDDLRKPVFREVGGSLLVLSPLGSRVTALGALMAALERDLPVAYLSRSDTSRWLGARDGRSPEPHPYLVGRGRVSAASTGAAQ